MNTGTMCIYYARKQLQYRKVDAVEQKDMVNSGARGTMDRNLRTEVDCKVFLRASYLQSSVPLFQVGPPGYFTHISIEL
jgi:hypothetical protein